tara:strand:- start:267 stop:983 length:717 start_codon:yes stop_codon:yes gene_type:complete
LKGTFKKMETVMNKIKLSEDTLSILKNYSHINSNLLVKEGNQITTLSPAKNIVSVATVPENFPTEFGIWDLNKLLGTISLFEDAEFEFDEKSMNIIGSGGAKVSYYYSEPRLLTVLEREVKVPETVVTFTLTEEVFNAVQKAAAVLQLPDLCVRSTEDGDIELLVTDKKTPTSNTYSIVVGENTSDTTFCFYLKIENIKLLGGDYDVDICKSVVCKFNHRSKDILYYIALESDSNYSE